MSTAEKTAPATDATSLKRFFKSQFGIPVRVQTGTGKGGWITVWIPSDRGNLHVLNYSHSFPESLGRQCAEIVYPGNDWCWCGNIGRHSIAMRRPEWERLLSQYQGA